jgi:4-diphosphocytidyl-2-C-methyl-D-erythritol kinase
MGSAVTGQSLEAWTHWPAPAKLNLFLRIMGRREDGYHHLQTVFQLLDWGDAVHLRLRADGVINRMGGGSAHIQECDDLLIKAAKSLKNATNSSYGVDLYVDKQIPVGGGFGGGSSDAATVLVALNQLWATGLSPLELAALGLKLGADVPVFVHGHSAWAEGIGEKLTPLPLTASWFLLVDPGLSVPTRDLFQAPELTRDAAPATIADFVSGAVLGNAFEPVLRRLQPAVDAVLLELSQYGQACLTGTGSGCFLRFSSQSAAEEVQVKLSPGLRSWVVAGVMDSPLLGAVSAFVESK